MTSHRFVELLIQAARENTSALRSVTKLQPAGGPGAKVMPPTYEGGAYALEKRLINGAQVDTVLLDSVQSQANRFEERLIEGARSGQIRIPYFEVRVPGHEALTSLTVPHRVHDAILRD
jgi:CRISPR-associated protein Csb1